MVIGISSVTLHAEPGFEPAAMPAVPPAAGEAPTLKADTDGDGKLNFEEFKAARLRLIQQQFEQMDDNHDGYLDAGERQQAVTRMKSKLQSLRTGQSVSP